MTKNPLRRIHTLGQSIWLDYIGRDLLDSGELRRLITVDGVRGITSNPAIFERSITGSHDCEDDIRAMALQGKDAMAIYEALSQRDVKRAADEFRHLYDSTDAADGYVSLEVNPHLAHDTRCPEPWGSDGRSDAHHRRLPARCDEAQYGRAQLPRVRP